MNHLKITIHAEINFTKLPKEIKDQLIKLAKEFQQKKREKFRLDVEVEP